MKPLLFENQAELEKLLTVSEVAAALKVSPRTIYGWHYKGVLTAEKLGPRLIRFSLKKVLEELHKGEGYGR